jgi:molybdopterin converting factor small subunit
VPAITIGLPASLTAPGPAQDYALEAATVGAALRALVERAPQYEQRVFYRDRLLVVVTLNGRQLQPERVEKTELSAGDRLDILMPVAGG